MTTGRRPKVVPINEAASAKGRAADFNLESTIGAMRLDFLQCRDFGHSWRPYRAEWSVQDRCYNQQLRCARCKSIRERSIGRGGQRLSVGYDYTDGYLITGMGQLSTADRDVIRLQSILRVLPEDTAAEG